jgi:membrane protease YdiL (CAAX protease family)
MMLHALWNSSERRLRAGWRLILQLGLYLLLSGLFGAIISLAGALVIGLQVGFAEVIKDPQQFAYTLLQAASVPSVLNLLSGAASLLGILASLGVTARWIDRRPLADYGFHFNRGWWRDLGFGLGLGLGLMVVVFGVEYLAGWLTVTAVLQTSQAGTPFWAEWLMWLVFFICVGIYEELFSRGYQLRNMAEGLNLPSFVGRPLALTRPESGGLTRPESGGLTRPESGGLILGYLLSSVVFGSLHFFNANATLISTLNLMLAGLFLGFGFVITGELAIPIGLHIAWNFCQGNVFGFPVSGTNAGATVFAIRQGGPAVLTGGAFGPEGGLLGVAVMLLGFLLTAWWVVRTRGQISLHELLAKYQLKVDKSG